MSRWTHQICDDCWDIRNPNKLSPRGNLGDDEPCCFCGEMNRSGIYIRHDPDDENLACGGQHE